MKRFVGEDLEDISPWARLTDRRLVQIFFLEESSVCISQNTELFKVLTGWRFVAFESSVKSFTNILLFTFELLHVWIYQNALSKLTFKNFSSVIGISKGTISNIFLWSKKKRSLKHFVCCFLLMRKIIINCVHLINLSANLTRFKMEKLEESFVVASSSKANSHRLWRPWKQTLCL